MTIGGAGEMVQELCALVCMSVQDDNEPATLKIILNNLTNVHYCICIEQSAKQNHEPSRHVFIPLTILPHALFSPGSFLLH